VAIGLLPSYASICSCTLIVVDVVSFWSGVGLGGEWGGAVLLAIENAPANKRAWYGMFPQLGVSIGLFLEVLFYSRIP
jgi:hypothetical protein